MNTRADITGSLAVNPQSLDALRTQAKQSPEQALKATAQQFESVFLNMMLKSMRDASPQDGMFDSEQTKMFTGMLDQQLAQNMSSRGVGLADAMVKQLSHSVSPDAAPAVIRQNAISNSLGLSRGAAINTPVKSASITSNANALPSAYSENTQQEFVQRMTPYALQASRETGVPAHLMIGQAALESGWGKREIRLPDGSNSFNLFGIKATGDWKGKVAEVVTTEYHNGVASKLVQKFRAYGSYAEAFSDYAHMLSGNPRYSQVVQPGQAAPAAAQALQRAGYATDPHYADKLVKVMSKISSLG